MVTTGKRNCRRIAPFYYVLSWSVTPIPDIIMLMPPEVDQTIVAKLKTCASQGLTFYQAKQQLAQDGYSEEAIQLAADNYAYGSVPPPADPATAVFATDSADTEKVGADMLKDAKAIREEEAISDGLAGEAGPDIQTSVKYQNNYLHDIGMSWWTWLFINAVIVGVIVFFHLPHILASVVVIILIIVFAVKRAWEEGQYKIRF